MLALHIFLHWHIGIRLRPAKERVRRCFVDEASWLLIDSLDVGALVVVACLAGRDAFD